MKTKLNRLARFELWRSKFLTLWYWRFRGANGEIVASGEGYSRKVDARDAIVLLKGSASAKVVTVAK